MFQRSKSVFHFYHLVSLLVSIQAYLFSSFMNTTATKWGFTFSKIGFLNFIASFIYALASITIGHLGDKYGYKKVISILFLYLFTVSVIGFFVRNSFFLYLFALAQGLFFGSFFPQIEGLIAKSEMSLDIDPPSITGRFTLSWSTGNIFGMAFGPYFTVHEKYVIFIYGLIISTTLSLMIFLDAKKNGALIKFQPVEKLRKHTDNAIVVKDRDRMERLRFEYRIILFLGGIIYTSVLADFPKLITMAGLKLSKSGFLTVGANIGVLLTFVLLQSWKKWVGNEKICALLLLVVPITGMLAFFAKTPLTFFFTAFMAGCSYAVPYTFAIFYGLLSTSHDHGKQGALHEMVIGLLFGIGPLAGGLFLDIFKSSFGLTLLSLILTFVIYSIQMFFNTRKVLVEK